MYEPNPSASGAKWLFLLAIIVLAAFLMLGADIAKATWMNGKIAAAQAGQISSQTEIDLKNAELDYEQRKFNADLEMQKAQQLAAHEEHMRSQELQAKTAKDAQSLTFQKNMHTAALFGVQVLAIALGLGLFVASIASGIGLSRYLTAKAQVKVGAYSNGRMLVKIEQLTRQVHVLQEKVAETEHRDNHRTTQAAVNNTVPIWPEDTEQLTPKKYPLGND